jgi:hypothetical protein
MNLMVNSPLSNPVVLKANLGELTEQDEKLRS